jgi:hypothetical protein
MKNNWHCCSKRHAGLLPATMPRNGHITIRLANIRKLMPGSRSGGNRAWAPDAPVLLVSCGYKNFPGTDVYNRHWMHDVGAANISIALQAASMGMQLHQMAGFDVEACARLLGLDTEKIEPVTMMTLGYPGPADRLAEPFRTRETLPRERKEVKSFVHKLE